jgi:hypothetical protein
VPGELADCAVVALAVPDDAAAETVLCGYGLLGSLEADAVVLVHSTTTTPESSRSHRFSARLDRQNMVEDLVGIPSPLRFLEFLVVPAVVQLGPWDA